METTTTNVNANKGVITEGANTKEEGIRITCIDLGNMNIKYIGQSGKGDFSSKISTDYKAYEEGYQRIQQDDKITYIGIGSLSREFNKVDRDYTSQLLYALAKANNDIDIIETNLTLLLPAGQMDNKGKIIEMLKGKEFNFKFNGVDKMVKVHKIMVLPEGYASFYSLSEEDKDKDICILDLGSRTINICCMINGEIETLTTVKYGSFDFYTKIKNLEKGEDYKEEDIPRLIKNGTIKVIEKSYKEFRDDILNYIKPYVNIKTYQKIVLTGGTSLMLEKELDGKVLKVDYEVNEDALNSNIKGAYEASKIMWEVA
ncbi:ParM/StbA family protein [Clostridium scatologenes]|uniref:Actin-like protein N-terminal domain-containing protein n=1 Tax=Clostridium scatologenes TaxID=1548 RepID=A0A0E3K1M3_CLOSL|nr:ParM/StbA family protein [Clostridium scatologenes]AKA70168.1 hypothetical protein CSCA_3043 [Clostridium scatologenes]